MFFAELCTFNIDGFIKEHTIEINQDKKYVVDGTIVISNNANAAPVAVEIDYTDYTSIDKIKDIIGYLEHKNNVPYSFIVVRLSQEEIEVSKIGNQSTLYLVPWNLNQFSSIVITSLRSLIDGLECR